MRAGARACVLNARQPRQSVRDLLTRLGLTGNLKLCLDAGDADSYSSGQSWLDRSGNGHDFFRGADNTSSATDPTFNGTAGAKSKNEFWSFDGGDYFIYDSANEAWMNNIHKAGAKFTLAAWIFYGATPAATAAIAGTGNANTVLGWRWSISSTGTLGFTAGNGTGAVVTRNAGSMTTVPGNNQWCFVAISMDAGGGATGCTQLRNATPTVGDSTYTSPSASDAATAMKIAASGSAASGAVPSDFKLANFMAWEGVALTASQMRNIYDATYRRFQ